VLLCCCAAVLLCCCATATAVSYLHITYIPPDVHRPRLNPLDCNYSNAHCRILSLSPGPVVPHSRWSLDLKSSPSRHEAEQRHMHLHGPSSSSTDSRHPPVDAALLLTVSSFSPFFLLPLGFPFVYLCKHPTGLSRYLLPSVTSSMIQHTGRPSSWLSSSSSSSSASPTAGSILGRPPCCALLSLVDCFDFASIRLLLSKIFLSQFYICIVTLASILRDLHHGQP
jgi:hypothetical protein